MSDDKDDIQEARDWMGTIGDGTLPATQRATLLRALGALEREGPLDAEEQTQFTAWLDARATLASCDRARRAAEEECARLREQRDALAKRAVKERKENDALVAGTCAELDSRVAQVAALTNDRDRLAADNAELEAALAAQREAMQVCVDSDNRLAAMVARVRALVDSGHGVDADVSLVAVSRALDGEVTP